jgi:hypothetical protein
LKYQKINPQGIYAGLAPAIPELAARRPTLSTKLKATIDRDIRCEEPRRRPRRNSRQPDFLESVRART